MSQITEQQLKDAFDVIKNAFEENLNEKIIAIKGISFITEDSAEEADIPGSFRLAFHPLHNFTVQECVRVGGKWVCKKGH